VEVLDVDFDRKRIQLTMKSQRTEQNIPR